MADGYVGKYQGKKVYYCESDEYFNTKDYCDQKDIMWLLVDTSLLLYKGHIIGKVGSTNNNGQITQTVHSAKSDDIYYYYPKYKPVKTAPQTKSAQALGNTTKGLNHTVTERKSVDWYMQHTIDVLNEGVKYGQEALQKLRAQRAER